MNNKIKFSVIHFENIPWILKAGGVYSKKKFKLEAHETNVVTTENPQSSQISSVETTLILCQ